MRRRRRVIALAALLLPSLVGVLAACGHDYSAADDAPDGSTEQGDATPETSVGDTTDAAFDASADAGFTPCALRGAVAFLCADFDDSPTPALHTRGTVTAVPSSATRSVRSFGKTAPNALWSDIVTALVEPITVSGETTATHTHAELDIFVDGYAAAPTEGSLVRLGIIPDQCYADVTMSGGIGVVLQTHCSYGDASGDFYEYKQLLPAPLATGRWSHVVLDVDYANARAAASVDGQALSTITLNPLAKSGGVPFVSFGSIASARFAIDDVVAYTR